MGQSIKLKHLHFTGTKKLTKDLIFDKHGVEF